MLLQEFSETAAECVHMAEHAKSEHAKSEHDREPFIELARAWCGINENKRRDETPTRQ
jgi:hypothetical protein